MKRQKFLILSVMALLVMQVGFSQTIVGSKHDLSTQAWNTSGQICIVCHTPHNASLVVADAPLWNHQTTTATFTIYASPWTNATITQPTASSKLCLSCHDGTVALENFGGFTTGTNFIGGVYNLGTNILNDHPISFTYDAALATLDGGLRNPATAPSGLGGTIAQDMLENGKLQCSACHDVHNKYGVAKLLKKSNAVSALCLTCHAK